MLYAGTTQMVQRYLVCFRWLQYMRMTPLLKKGAGVQIEEQKALNLPYGAQKWK